MPSEELSEAVRGFIRNHIQAVSQLEILALLQTSPEREWSAREIDAILRSNEQAVACRLAEFSRSGLLTEVGGAAALYRYDPRTEALAAAAAETVQVFHSRPVLVIETIFKNDNQAKSFADAFRIRPR